MFALWLSLAGNSARAEYFAMCNSTIMVNARITSNFGEPRPTSGTMNRFHGGVDLGDCDDQDFVQAIATGVYATPTACLAPHTTCVRILEASGRAFDYEHLYDTAAVVGTSVAAGQTIGRVITGESLHLQESISVGQNRLRVNPLRQNALSFDHDFSPHQTTPPASYTTPTTMVLVPEVGGTDGAQATAPAFRYRNQTYYVSGKADFLVSGSGDTDRMGLYWVKVDVDQKFNSIPYLDGVFFNTFGDPPAGGFQTIYATRTPDSGSTGGFTFFASNYMINGVAGIEAADDHWDTTETLNGSYIFCPQIMNYPRGRTAGDCYVVKVDNAQASLQLKNQGGNYFNQATSNTSVTIEGSDAGSGIYAIGLVGVSYSSWHYVNDVATFASNTFPDSGSLADGAYAAYVVDLASNVTSGAFSVDTVSISSLPTTNAFGAQQGAVVISTNNFVLKSSQATTGVCGMTMTNPDASSTTVQFAASTIAAWGPFVGALGTYSIEVDGCNGTQSSFSFYFSTASAANLAICATHPIEGTKCNTANPNPSETNVGNGYGEVVGFSHHSALDLGAYYQLQVEGQAITSLGGPNGYTSTFSDPVARSRSFTVTNTTSTTQDGDISITAHVRDGANDYTADVSFSSGIAGSGIITGRVFIVEVGQNYTATSTSMTFTSRLNGLSVSLQSVASDFLTAAYRQGLYLLGFPHAVAGSDFVLVQAGTMTFTALDPGTQPAVSTSTLKVYSWTGSSWTLMGIGQTSVTKSTTTQVVTAVANSVRSGTYAMLFSVTDASAPATSWSIQGSSYGFAGTVFVSTYSYLVLSSTDPTVDGFASGLATTYYRVDGLPGDAFTSYSSSLTFLPGTHWVDFYAVDWAGNSGVVQRATITVTAGSVTKLSADLQVDGNLLVGLLGSGAKAEVVARAEYDYALMVSSVDGRAMLAVDNANFASIGTAPASGRLTLAGVTQDTALALRSGNSTAAVTGAQLAFGFDGSGDLRHRVYTQHGSAANFNKMVFSLWTPATGSSSTLGNLPVLSLEGSTITTANALAHVMPAGIADKVWCSQEFGQRAKVDYGPQNGEHHPWE